MKVVKSLKKVYQVTIKVEDYPDTNPRVVEAHNVSICLSVKNNEPFPYTVGDKYKDYNAVVEKIIYTPKKWWGFWKHKKVLGAVIRFL